MKNIQVGILQQPSNPDKMSVFLARMTQRGHNISTMDDVYELFNKPVNNPDLRKNLASLNHGTIKRFDSYTVAVVGASRRFLAQIRTHQHADFVSGSLQYSDWSTIERASDWEKMFVVPYEIIGNKDLTDYYLRKCGACYIAYETIAQTSAGNDAAGFIMPNGLRNVLIIQANVQQWQYMIRLRACNRNSLETQYVMLRIWDELLKTENGEDFFGPDHFGIDCQFSGCHEGKFTCGEPFPKGVTPKDILLQKFDRITY